MLVQINFSVVGTFVPADHNYALYASLIRVNSLLRDIDWQLGTINGIPDKQGLIRLETESRWFIRIDHQYMDIFSNLSELRLGQWSATVKIESILKLDTPQNLSSRIVVIKGHSEIEFFYQSLLRKFPVTPIIGDRRTIKIKRFTVIGFSVNFFNLNPKQAEALLLNGLGGKRRLGCGVFCKVL